MKPILTLTAATLSLAVLLASPAPAAAASHSTATGRPSADGILRQMSSTLGSARSLHFEAHRQIDPALIGNRNLPTDAHIVVTILRPNKLYARSTSKGDVRDIYADGQNLTLVDVTKNFYASVPMRTSLDGLVAELDRKYGFTPPLAELALSNVYEDIRWKARSITYVGDERIPGGFLGLSGVRCHRLALSGQVLDAELWVGIDDHLPKKLVATAKTRAGKPQIKVDLSSWNLAPSVGEHEFTFVPPKDATKIPIATADGIRSPIVARKSKPA